jgi:flagellar biosynthesis protein FlhF
LTKRLKASQRRAKRPAPLTRKKERSGFGLTIAAHSAGEPGMTPRLWPSNDVAFLAAILEAHHVPAPLIERLAAVAAALPLSTPMLDRLSMALADLIHFAPLGDMLRAPVLVLLGPPAAGKTTLAAKLAARLGDRRALLVSTDKNDALGITHLQESAAVLGLRVVVARDAAELKHLVTEAAGCPVVIDTKGICPGDSEAHAELATLVTTCGAEPVLVLPADSPAEDAIALVHRFAPFGPSTLIPTRLDLTRRLGGVVAAAHAGRLALPAGGTTPHFAYGLPPLTSSMMARRLLAVALNEPRSQTLSA